MAKPKVFIDGREGTTGLQIFERLGDRPDIELLTIDESLRKDLSERSKYLNSSDIVFLCLPDTAAVQAVSMIENPLTRVIDASTAHRTDKGWAYGFPELAGSYRSGVAGARFVTNPGCHATGAIATIAPLVAKKIIPRDYPVTIFSLTGYSGGGKAMIAQYESPDKQRELFAPRLYATALRHKHLPEIRMYTNLEHDPVFCPVVDDYYSGMATTVMLHNRLLSGGHTAKSLCEVMADHYSGRCFVEVKPFTEENGILNSNHLVGTNRLEITVSGDDDMTILTARFDNLGKGASGAAVQNMNIMLGLPEDTYLS